MSKHTAGPFTAIRQNDESGAFWWDIWSETAGHSVAHVGELARPPEGRKTIRKDLALFTAAPDLLAVVERYQRLADLTMEMAPYEERVNRQRRTPSPEERQAYMAACDEADKLMDELAQLRPAALKKAGEA